jgi:S1-C subfamily serine protease
MDDPSPSGALPWWTRLARRTRAAAPFATGVLATILALWLYGRIVPSQTPLTPKEINEAVAQAMASATPPPTFSSRVYQVIRPSIVLIQTKSGGSGQEADFGLGSGVVIDVMGDILTSLHVVADASEIQITFADGTQSAAQVVNQQPENDIAVVRAMQPPAELWPAVLGNPYASHVGDDAFAVGNPFGLYSSMSAGVISGFNRSFQAENSDRKLEGLIQFDAAVNPGNSGGPLLNRSGQVIGIVTGILNPEDQEVFIGIGFAVPINVAGAAAGLPAY